MAVIALSSTRIWHGSASILRLVVDQLRASAEFQQYQAEFSRILDGGQALDARNMTAVQLAAFRTAVRLLISRVIAAGPDRHGGTAYHSGLIARLTELESLLMKNA